MAEDNDAPRRKGRDPILMVGTIVLALAFVVVISGYVYAEYISTDNTPAEYGKTVKVDYVGAYYGWYDGYNAETGAFDAAKGTIFDTSLWSVAKSQGEDNEEYSFSNEFKKRSEKDYVHFDVTPGSGKALTAFENAVIGKKPGDVVYIKIEDGYGTVPDDNLKKWDTKMTGWNFTERMTSSVFMTTFDKTSTALTSYTNLEHPYGWKCDAVVGNDGYVMVTHNVKDLIDDPDKAYKAVNGGMSVKVTSNADATKFNLEFIFDEDYYKAGKLVQFKYDGKTYYVTEVAVAADGKTQTGFTTKDTTEIIGMDLYFKMTIIGYE
ncbi:MAG: FKBP-type peptidyl-prolyl cis-trans isomerase [Methanomassiliicoccaceae archaeon]|jgi:hypothetical protein|nr:FKBP-type peptidyl-prolyl cis-trans isomerase [Methanomassiliicoccaceae archaeon]